MNYKNLILLLCFFLLSASAYSLSLRAEVDRSTIASNESLRLLVTADESSNDAIDFSQLEHQFDIINTQRSNQTSIINGSVSASTQWILILVPKETGQLVIPSFEYKGSYSQAITITVSNATTPQETNIDDLDVFLQASLDKNRVYVQEQSILTLRLYYKTALSSYEADELKLTDSAIETLSENTFQTTCRGKRFTVLEKMYAIYPQASGTLNIPAQSWRLEKSLRSFGFGRSGNPYLYAKSEPLVLTVDPIPDASTATNWLPASNVTLNGQWKQSILNARVGEPINYQLKLNAIGLTAAQLPTITLPETSDFSIYSDQADIDNAKSSAGIIGSRTSNFAIIPRKAGQLSFPDITLKWWNIVNNKEETITLPAQAIIVTANNVEEKSAALPQLPSLPPVTNVPLTNIDNTTWRWQSATVVLGIICSVLLFLLHKSRQSSPNNTTEHTSKLSMPPSVNKKELITAMQTAANQKNWPELRKLILKWGQNICEQPNINSLTLLGHAIPTLQLHLQQLDNHLYGQHPNDSWQPQLLIEELRQYQQNTLKTPHEVLKPLYK
jgi:hypothetical protein